MFTSKISGSLIAAVVLCVVSAGIACLPAEAQSGSPIPGADSAPNPGGTGGVNPFVPGLPVTPQAPVAQSYAPVPGGGSPVPGMQAPASRAGAVPAARMPGALPPGAPHAGTPYSKLPLSASGAAARLEELRNLQSMMPAKPYNDALDDFSQWLQDMADAHWRISQTFAKHDSTKAQADVEKHSALKFGTIRRQAMLLKAEFLVQHNRQPEALAPLIDIVVAEPRTETGQNAYKLLKQIGFVDELPAGAAAAAGAATPVAPEKVDTGGAAVASPASITGMEAPTAPTAVAAPRAYAPARYLAVRTRPARVATKMKVVRVRR